MARDPGFGAFSGRHQTPDVDLSSLLGGSPPFGAAWNQMQQSPVRAVRTRDPGLSFVPAQMQQYLGNSQLGRHAQEGLLQFGASTSPAFQNPPLGVQQALQEVPSKQHVQVSSQLLQAPGHSGYHHNQQLGVGNVANTLGWGNDGGGMQSIGHTQSRHASPTRQSIVHPQARSSSPPIANLLGGTPDAHGSFTPQLGNQPSLLSSENLNLPTPLSTGDDVLINDGDRLVAELMRETQLPTQEPQLDLDMPLSTSPKAASAQINQQLPHSSPPQPPQQQSLSSPARDVLATTSSADITSSARKKGRSSKGKRGRKPSIKKTGRKPVEAVGEPDQTEDKPIVDFFQDVDRTELEIDYSEYAFWDLNLDREVDREQAPSMKFARTAPLVATAPLAAQEASRSAKLLKWAFGEHTPDSWFS